MTVDAQTLIVTVPIVAAIVQVLKIAGVRSSLAPLAAVIIGILVAVGAGISETWTWRIVTGLAIGAAASGFYDYAKAIHSAATDREP